MASVTQRCKQIRKPSQYISLKEFEVLPQTPNNVPYRYESRNVTPSSIGMAVDYLVRMYLGDSPEKAFEISLKGAKQIDNFRNTNDAINFANKQLRRLNRKKIDNITVLSALNLVQFDQAYRTEQIPYSIIDIEDQIRYSSLREEELIDMMTAEIKELVRRSIVFFTKQSVISTEYSFEEGYTDIIKTGDGDIACSDTLWDIKVINKTPEKLRGQTLYQKYSGLKPGHALQVLVYYLLGIHSKYKFYQGIKYIGLYNPATNKAYRLAIKDIKDKVKYEVSNKVIGYKMVSQDYENWEKVDGTDPEILRDEEKRKEAFRYVETNFSPENYQDGIHKISLNDYITFLKVSNFYDGETREPYFSFIHEVFLLKKGKYIMFVTEKNNGEVMILRGATPNILPNNKEYYYEHLSLYGDQVINVFSKYWHLLYEYAHSIKETGFNGKVHGNIVDLDSHHHVYVNPLDYTIHGYYANSMSDKYFYNSVERLIKEVFPDLLENYQKIMNKNCPKLIQIAGNDTGLKELVTTEVIKNNRYQLIDLIQTTKNTRTYVKDTKMYKASNRLRALQYVYDQGWVAVWDDFIFDSITKRIN